MNLVDQRFEQQRKEKDVEINGAIDLAVHKKWFYDWLRDLDEWKSSVENTDRDWQVCRVPDHPEDTVRNVRAKLASLQTQMVFTSKFCYFLHVVENLFPASLAIDRPNKGCCCFTRFGPGTIYYK